MGKAREAGASKEEVEEVIAVTRAVMQTRAKDTRDFTQQLLSAWEYAAVADE